MGLHLTAKGCHLPHGITVLPATRYKWTHPALTTAYIGLYLIYLPWKAELTYVTGYIPRRVTRPQTVTHPSINPAANGRESNSQSVDHKSDALTTTPPSHLVPSSVTLFLVWSCRDVCFTAWLFVCVSLSICLCVSVAFCRRDIPGCQTHFITTAFCGFW